MWHIIETPIDVPSDRDVHLAVIEGDKVHELVFPCRRAGKSWINATSGRVVEVYPTHWQEWDPKSES